MKIIIHFAENVPNVDFYEVCVGTVANASGQLYEKFEVPLKSWPLKLALEPSSLRGGGGGGDDGPPGGGPAVSQARQVRERDREWI